ncbi:MAG: uroporphyrinogen decarboxylase family protein [Armatimonadota bacterium]
MLDTLATNAQLALDTIHQKPTRGIPSWLLNPMEHAVIERLAGAEPGAYRRDPETVYLAMQHAIGTCLLDQYIPLNPLSMGDQGYEGDTERSATTGVERIELDGLEIDSPEVVVEHLERFAFPRLAQQAAAFDEEAAVRDILAEEAKVQQILGPDILKSGYGFIGFPGFAYFSYGYANYFMALALYPEIIERHFALQADVCVLRNRAAARAYREGKLPPIYRLDHDMADSRGTLVNIAWLDEHWFPHFARSLAPVLGGDIKLIWHCDGNLMEMVPRLLEVGIAGFQGFQYEDGMDYETICAMKTKDGNDLVIIGGVSVTRTLPMGTPEDVKREMRWLVDCGPKTGLFLACSSSIAPGVSWENMRTLVEGLAYYREHGRDG